MMWRVASMTFFTMTFSPPRPTPHHDLARFSHGGRNSSTGSAFCPFFYIYTYFSAPALHCTHTHTLTHGFVKYPSFSGYGQEKEPQKKKGTPKEISPHLPRLKITKPAKSLELGLAPPPLFPSLGNNTENAQQKKYMAVSLLLLPPRPPSSFLCGCHTHYYSLVLLVALVSTHPTTTTPPLHPHDPHRRSLSKRGR